MTIRGALCILLLVATGCISESDAVLLHRIPGARADLERVLADLPAAAPSLRVASSWSDPPLPAEQLTRIRRALEHAEIDEGVLKREVRSSLSSGCMACSTGVGGRGLRICQERLSRNRCKPRWTTLDLFRTGSSCARYQEPPTGTSSWIGSSESDRPERSMTVASFVRGSRCTGSSRLLKIASECGGLLPIPAGPSRSATEPRRSIRRAAA